MNLASRLIAQLRATLTTRELLGFATLLLVLAVACSGEDSSNEAPRLSAPNAAGQEVANEFLTLLQKKDVPGLQVFLSDAFIIQRADGSSATKSEYLANLPVVGPYEIGELKANQDGNTLVVRWMLTVQTVINGQPYRNDPAPRLSTFAWSNDRWRMVSYANFNAPQ